MKLKNRNNNREPIQRIHETKNWFLQKINKLTNNWIN